MFYTTKNNFDMLDDFGTMFNSLFSGNMKSDVIELDDHYELMVDVPGIDKRDISINFNDSTLIIKVESKKEKNNDVKYLFKERTNTSMERSFILEDGDESNISAKLDSGVLLVNVGKKKKIEKKITISID